VAPGVHAPSFTQAPKSDQTPLLHDRDWVPQLPHAWVAGPAQGWPPHALHWQVAPQLWLPPVPQAWVAPGTHAPSFAHALHGDQTPFVHARVWVPQLPHAWVAGPAQV
jgi:hypothetical protein